MKKVVSLLFISMLLILAACSDNGEESSYDPSDYEFSGVSTSSEEVELFQEEEKALYLYFTGVD